MTITVLIENTGIREDLETEHGLSFHIDTGQSQTVFDTGASPRFAQNAERLGIDLSRIEGVILSHGHYDHSGGLSSLGLRTKELPIYCHPTANIPRFSIKNPLEPRPVGIPPDGLEMLKYNPVIDTEGPTKLNNFLHITGFIPRLTDYEDVGGPFYLDPLGKHPDLIPDDQALWFKTANGLVVLLGCAHAGVINTLHYCQKLSGVKRVFAVIGGFHLLNADEDRLEQTIQALRQINPEILAPCHCTGDSVIQLLAREFPSSARVCSTGSVFTFPIQSTN